MRKIGIRYEDKVRQQRDRKRREPKSQEEEKNKA